MNGASINDHYTHDHARLDELFQQFQKLKSSDCANATRQFQEFKSGLEQHIAWEEEILFPSFERRFGPLGGPTAVLRWEHLEIRRFLNAIAEALARNDWDTEVEDVGLNAVLCPHNYKEESILYPMIDQITGDAERAEIFAKMGKNT